MRYLFLSIAVSLIACNNQPATTVTKDTVVANEPTATERDTISTDNSKAQTKPDTAIAAEPASNKLIVEGRSVGNVEIGMDDSKLEVFGKPDMSDAAMGKAWLTWYGKKPDEHNNKTQLNVYTTYKDTSMRSKTVQQIRTTSSFFETANGLHVYSAFNEIQEKFQKLKKAATYTDEGRDIVLYDAQQQGIAFEIATANNQQICTGIIVHKPGIKVTQVYLSLHPEMHIL